jgi:hypothetical protein
MTKFRDAWKLRSFSVALHTYLLSDRVATTPCRLACPTRPEPPHAPHSASAFSMAIAASVVDRSRRSPRNPSPDCGKAEEWVRGRRRGQGRRAKGPYKFGRAENRERARERGRRTQKEREQKRRGEEGGICRLWRKQRGGPCCAFPHLASAKPGGADTATEIT